METKQIVTVDANANVEVTNVEAQTVELLKRYVLANEELTLAKSVLENLKPHVETARVLYGSPKSFRLNGRVHNTRGSFGVTHVAKTTRTASVKAVDELLAAGVITPEQYATVVSESDSEYNLVTFKTKEA